MAIESVLGGYDKGGRDHQQGDDVAHRHLKGRIGKDCGSQSKGQQDPNSADECRDVQSSHRFAS